MVSQLNGQTVTRNGDIGLHECDNIDNIDGRSSIQGIGKMALLLDKFTFKHGEFYIDSLV